MAHPLGWVLWHRSAKFMTIDLWYIGVLLRLLQILVIVYFILTTFISGAWAYSETPRANINAWGETGGARAAATAASSRSRNAASLAATLLSRSTIAFSAASSAASR